MNRFRKHQPIALLFVAALFVGPLAWADVVTDWNIKAGEIFVEAKLGTPPANRVMAIAHAAVYEAANAITKRYPASGLQLEAAPGASVDAAVAAAGHATLVKLLPAQQAAFDSAYRTSLALISEGTAKTAGIAQFRPGPPPTLTSALWARDYDEVKALGAKNSTRRTAEQTEIARFWEATLPPIYHGVVRSVAAAPGREVTQNARLFMAVTQAMDDATSERMRQHWGGR